MSERALLEGYRMGLHASGAGKGGDREGGKGGGKGGKGANVKPAATGDKLDRTCQREGCRAAERQQPTWGGAFSCHCCGLSLRATLPVEQLCDAAYQKRLEVQRAAQKDAAAKGTGSTPAAKPTAAPRAKGTPATATKEELAAKRTERLAELKEAKEVVKETPTQEVARVFLSEKPSQVKLKIKEETIQEVAALDQRAKVVLDSIMAEALPSDRPLLAPPEVVKSLLAKSTEYKTDAGKGQAEAALSTTQACLATMRSGGSSDGDELLLLMEAREKKQLLELARLTDKAPSQDMRKETLSSIRQNYVKQLQAQADHRANGASKAAERADTREKLAAQILAAAQKLNEEVMEAKQQLMFVHAQRAELKKTQGEKILELIDEKLDELTSEDVLFEDAEEDQPAATATETERDESRRLSSLLEKQLNQLKAAATAAETMAAQQPAVPTPTAAAEPWGDLHMDFPAEPSQLPSMENAPADLKEAAARVNALLQVVPWGCPLPAVQFEHLQILPAAIHTLVGDVIWKTCWGDRHMAITPQHAVPYKLLNIIKSVVEKMAPAVTDAHRTTASEIYRAAMQRTESRRSSAY